MEKVKNVGDPQNHTGRTQKWRILPIQFSRWNRYCVQCHCYLEQLLFFFSRFLLLLARSIEDFFEVCYLRLLLNPIKLQECSLLVFLRPNSLIKALSTMSLFVYCNNATFSCKKTNKWVGKILLLNKSCMNRCNLTPLFVVRDSENWCDNVVLL